MTVKTALLRMSLIIVSGWIMVGTITLVMFH